MYHGDLVLGETLDLKFTTRRFSTGAPFTLAGSPVISAYPGNSTTQLTAGITLTVDFDTVTGLNNVRIVASSGNGYATATNYTLVITTGTVDGISVVGEVIGSFSIENRLGVLGKALTEPSAVPAWATATPLHWLAWLGALSSNPINETASLLTLRNRADAATIATAALEDDGVTFIRWDFE